MAFVSGLLPLLAGWALQGPTPPLMSHSRGAPRASGVNLAVSTETPVILEIQHPPLPESALSKWEVHKFGGASLANADLYRQCGDLLIAESARPKESAGSYAPTMAIVSAKGGVTDKLINVVQAAMDDMTSSAELLRKVVSDQIEIVRSFSSQERTQVVEQRMQQDEEDVSLLFSPLLSCASSLSPPALPPPVAHLSPGPSTSDHQCCSSCRADEDDSSCDD